MVIYKTGDLLTDPNVTLIAHGCNCFCAMKSGIAKSVVRKWPRVAEVDKKTHSGYIGKLGLWSEATVGEKKRVLNLYTQYEYGREKRKLNYEAIYKCFAGVEEKYRYSGEVLGLPHGIGCGLAGGNWRIVNAMIDVVFSQSTLSVYVIKLPTN